MKKRTSACGGEIFHAHNLEVETKRISPAPSSHSQQMEDVGISPDSGGSAHWHTHTPICVPWGSTYDLKTECRR